MKQLSVSVTFGLISSSRVTAANVLMIDETVLSLIKVIKMSATIHVTFDNHLTDGTSWKQDALSTG